MHHSASSLIFVYNADSGLFNTLADIGHKVFSPDTYQCNLCALTHGYLREKSRWKRFIGTLEIPCEFLHRDQFRQRFPGNEEPLPAVFRRDANDLRVCLSAEELAGCSGLEELERLVRERCL